MWRWRRARQAFIWAADLFQRKKRWSGCGAEMRRRIFLWVCLAMKWARPSLRKKLGQITFSLVQCTRRRRRRFLGCRKEFTGLRKSAKRLAFRCWRLGELRKATQASVFAEGPRESRRFGCFSRRGMRNRWRPLLRRYGRANMEAPQDTELFHPPS